MEGKIDGRRNIALLGQGLPSSYFQEATSVVSCARARLRHHWVDLSRAETYVEFLLQIELEGPLRRSSEQSLLKTYCLSQGLRNIRGAAMKRARNNNCAGSLDEGQWSAIFSRDVRGQKVTCTSEFFLTAPTPGWRR